MGAVSRGFIGWLKHLFDGEPTTPVPQAATPPLVTQPAPVAAPKTKRQQAGKKRSDNDAAKAAEHRKVRQAHWAQRIPQLLENVDRRPMWQFRTVGDGGDPPACSAVNGRIERFDSEFWQKHNPARCRRRYCRCTIRACTPEEAASFGTERQ